MYILKGCEDGRTVQWPLKNGVYRLGRSVDNDLHVKDRSVSRKHAVIEIKNSEILVEDTHSHNGSRVNGLEISGPTMVRPGDTLHFGNIELKLATETDTDAVPVWKPDATHDDIPLNTAVSLSWDEVQNSIGGSSNIYQDLFRMVQEAGQLLVVPRSLEELLDTMLNLVERTISPGRIVLLLREEEGSPPVVRAARPPDSDSAGEMLLSRTIVDAVIDNRTSLLVTDIASDPRFQEAESIISLKLRSAMAAPLFDNKEVIGLIYADTSEAGSCYSREQLGAFTILANMIAVKISNTRLLEEERKKELLEQEMAAAAKIQQSLLPASLPEPPGYEMVARQIPCLQTAGDLYEARILDDGQIGIALGDVSGKGAGAALLMSHVMAFLRVLYTECADLTEFAARLNTLIYDCSEPTSFVTLFLGKLNPETHTLEYVNAGHDLPFVLSSDGSEQRLDSTGIPIGLLPRIAYSSARIPIPPGTLFCVYSDGIPEAQVGETFYEERRFHDGLKQRAQLPLEDIADGIEKDLKLFLGDTPSLDDITYLLLRRLCRDPGIP